MRSLAESLCLIAQPALIASCEHQVLKHLLGPGAAALPIALEK